MFGNLIITKFILSYAIFILNPLDLMNDPNFLKPARVEYGSTCVIYLHTNGPLG